MDVNQNLKTINSFQTESDTSSAMFDISLSNDSLNLPHTIYEKETFNAEPLTIKKQKSFKKLELAPVKDFDIKILPFILKHLSPSDLLTCLQASWQWYTDGIKVLYKHITFTQLSGHRLKSFHTTIQKSILTSDGKRNTLIDYISLVEMLTISHIVFDNDTPLQSWDLVRDIIVLCSAHLKLLSLSIGDLSFEDLPNDYVYVPSLVNFPKLTHLRLYSTCAKLPEHLVMELLRSTPSNQLVSIRLPKCLTNLTASTWFLICDKGGTALTELVVTPSSGRNMLAWEEQPFVQGLTYISKKCESLKKLDISGHTLMVPFPILEDLVTLATDMTEMYFPCQTNDSHLQVFMNHPPWIHLKTLGLSCQCVDGKIKEEGPNGASCNRFVDTFIISFLNYLLMGVQSDTFQVYLPTFLISIQTGKSIKTVDFLSNCGFITKRDLDRFWFKDRIVLSVPTNRLENF
ncbi:hypothetical protein BC833DRAFT_595528 [Globomyces pollinis-pini]|nr:hypothetical protein BC833DRAFT_595528 [Globomyces pollinis-pini]